MNRRFTPFALAVTSLALAACEGSVPDVKGRDLVIPDRSPSRAVQALSSPSTADASSGSNSEAYCLDARAGLQQFNEDGSFITETDCSPGGGIAKVRNEGTQDELGNGSYDQTTIHEDETQHVWHFTYTTSADFLTTTYVGVSEDGSETYEGVYTYLGQVGEVTSNDMTELWNLDEGTYQTAGIVGSDGSFAGTQSFDDPATDASPDWIMDSVSNADGFSQDVHFVGEGFVSDYTYVVDALGNADYAFATDMEGTEVDPDFAGEYVYAADGSGSGSYMQSFDDGSTLLVSDVIAADGSLVESWIFDDSATDQDVDQEGSMAWALDGSASGTVTSHVVGGGEQTCDVNVSADGVQTIANCT